MGALMSPFLTAGGPVHPGSPGHGAFIQQPLCAQGPGCSQLPGQRSETGEGVGSGAQQGRVQQVEGHGWDGARGSGRMQFGGCGKGLLFTWPNAGGPRWSGAFSSSP